MPSELMDQRRMPSLCTPLVAFSDEIHMPPQRHVGFWKAESMHVHHGRDGLPLLFGNMSLSSQPLEKSRSVSLNSAENFPSVQDLHNEKQKAKLRHEHSAEAVRTAELSVTSWEATKDDLSSRSNLFVQPASLNVTINKFDLKGVPYENGFFASSLPHLPSKQLALLADDTLFVQPVNKVDSFAEEEPFDSLEAKEIEAQTIGNLLPDDEDLLSGVIDELERINLPNYWNDADEDLFSSGGGMELEADMKIDHEKHSNTLNGAFKNRNWGPNDSNGMEKSYGAQPSRTIFVGNVASNIEDTELKLLFQHYGDIHTIYTTCKSRGYIMVSYYDLRSACNAMASLQNKLLKNRKLDIHFSITKDNLFDREFSQGLLSVFNLDPSISNEDVHQIFGAYGEIRQIREHQNCRLVEFYDVRAAEAALHALNMSDMAGKRIEIFSGLPGGSRQSIMQHLPCEIEKIDANGRRPQGSLFRDSPSRCSVSAGTMLSNGLGSGSKEALHAITQSSVSGFMENGYDGFSYGSSHYLSSPAGVATAGSHHNQSGFDEHNHSKGHVNIAFDTIRNFHPHSLPEHHEALTNGTSFSSPNTISAMGINLVRHAEGVDNMHVPRVSSGGLASLPFGCNDRAFGSLGNGNNTLQGHGNQYAWNNSNSSYQQIQSPVMWHDSSLINNLPAQSPSQLQGLSRAHSHMLNTGVSLSQLHVGSAPTLNHSLWDRRHMYSGDLAEAFPFHRGSVESMGFYGSSTLHQMELGSPNIFPHLRGNFVEPMISSPQIGLPSPQKFHMFHGRSSVVNMPASLDGPNVRSRRGDANSNQVDNKKQYELDIDRIVRGEDNRTTLMIKNIPNKYTSKMLLAAIDENHRGTYDFIYLPIDFKNKCNVGYAFINMIEAQQIVLFYKSFNGKKWEKFNSEKVASLAYARIQGRSALIAHFQNSSLMNEDKRCRPILFHADGPNAGDQEPFPMGTNIRSRPGRSRAYNSEDSHQESLSNSTDGEDTSPVVDSFVPGKE